jgi:RNA polymerase sigma-70 factor (ECF subfamily)
MEVAEMIQPMVETPWKQTAREEAGFAAIVHDHQHMVYSICWHFFRNRALAEEIGQDVFLQLFRNLDSIDSPAHLEAWLRRTASNRCIDHYRRKGTQAEIPMEGMAEPSAHQRAADPMLSERLRRLVASLPEAQRMVVILKYQEDLDADEIADTLKMPVRTVWSHLRRAIAVLREKAGRCLETRPGEEL